MIQTIIFDMDGVIVDTEPVHRYAYFRHFDELGIHISNEEYTTFTGLSTKNVYQGLKEKFGLQASVEELINRKREFFNRAFDEKEDLDLLPGVRTLIEDVYTNGYELILASSAAKVTISRVFNRFKLSPYFSHIVSGEDFPKSKPDPAIFLYAASLAKSPKEQCVIIEDSTNGIQAANAAGIFCIGYQSEHSELQNLDGAQLVIAHFSELSAERLRTLV